MLLSDCTTLPGNGKELGAIVGALVGTQVEIGKVDGVDEVEIGTLVVGKKLGVLLPKLGFKLGKNDGMADGLQIGWLVICCSNGCIVGCNIGCNVVGCIDN